MKELRPRLTAAWRRTLVFALALAPVSACDKITPPQVQEGDRILFLDSPAEVTAGTFINPPIRVAVVDANGQTVPLSGTEVTLVLQPTSAADTLRGQPTSIFINGVAVFNGLSLDKVATGLRVAAVSKKLTGALSQPFNVNPGPATQLRFKVQPTNVVAGEPFSPAPVVEALDARGNLVPSFNGSVTIRVRTGPIGTVISGESVNCVNGVCTFPNLKLTRAQEGYTLIATTLGGSTTVISDATSAVFEVLAGPASKLVFRQNPFNNLTNAVFSPPILVAVTDTLDNTVRSASASITLAFSNNPSGATLGGTLTLPASNGSANFTDISVNKAGVNYRLQATATGLTLGLSNFFSIVASGSLQAGPESFSMRASPGSR
jgi:hypothetical protein